MKIAYLIIAALSVVTAFDASAQVKRTGRRTRPAHMVKPSGGLIFSQIEGKAVNVVNFEKNTGDKAVADAVKDLMLHIRVPMQIVKPTAGVAASDEVAALAKKPNVAAVVALTSRTDDKLLVYDTKLNAVYVNMRPLMGEGTPSKKVDERIYKQVFRALGLILKAGESSTAYSILRKADTVKELDMVTGKLPTPEEHNRMVRSIELLGMKMVKAGTYRTACQQGWAPKPTTPEQIKIWNEVYSPPTNPIKIKYQPKK